MINKIQESLQDLNTISEINLYHMETSRDEDWNGEWTYDSYEVCHGSIADNFPDEITNINQALTDALLNARALKLIFTKDVDIHLLRMVYVKNASDYNRYKRTALANLTDDEFNLITSRNLAFLVADLPEDDHS